MWTSLKESSDYTVIQKVFGRSLVNMLVVINNSIQDLHICELNFVDQFSPTNHYYVQYTFHICYEGHVIHCSENPNSIHSKNNKNLRMD